MTWFCHEEFLGDRSSPPPSTDRTDRVGGAAGGAEEEQANVADNNHQSIACILCGRAKNMLKTTPICGI